MGIHANHVHCADARISHDAYLPLSPLPLQCQDGAGAAEEGGGAVQAAAGHTGAGAAWTLLAAAAVLRDHTTA